MIMMKRVLLLFAALLLLVTADAAMHDDVEKKHTRKLAQDFNDRRTPERGVFYVPKERHPDHIADVANEPDPDDVDDANDVGANKNNNNDDNDDENLGYKNYGKGSDTETHRYFSSDKPYRP